MNKAILFFYCIMLLAFSSSGQVYDGGPMDSTINRFTADTIPNFISDKAAIPLWEIGRTHKSFFTADTNGTVAIMTDTLNNYPVNANNWFVIKVPNSFNTIIDFWHKFQMDSGRDGGVVEFSMDAGATWQNVKGACNIDSPGLKFSGVFTSNFYTFNDTLTTGEPAFTGSSSGEQYSRFQFFNGLPAKPAGSGTECNFWTDYYVRFRFISDSVADTLAGWMIDSIKIERDGYVGAVAKISRQKSLDTYPNPSYDGLFIFPSLQNEREFNMEVYDAMGRIIIKAPYQRTLNLEHQPPGLYFYRVSNGMDIYSGRIMLE